MASAQWGPQCEVQALWSWSSGPVATEKERTSLVARKCKHCPAIATHGRYCAKHRTSEHYISAGPPRTGKPKNRPVHEYDEEWARVSKAFLSKHPLCMACEHSGRLVPARIVDHILPIRSRPDLKYNADNFQSLCATRPYSCHQRKTGYERRGIILDFRNKRRLMLT